MGCAKRKIGLSLKIFPYRQMCKSEDLECVIEHYEISTNEEDGLFSSINRFSFGANENSSQEFCFRELLGLTQQPFQ